MWGEGIYRAKNGVWAVYIGGSYSPADAGRLRQFAIEHLQLREAYLGYPFFD
jgi:hypothetical protein